MIRWNNPAGFMAFGFLFLITSLQAQDLFDEGNSRIYAKHLFDEGRYELAAEEYGRLIQISEDDSLKIMFLKANRLSGNPDKALPVVKEKLPGSIDFSPRVAEEYVKLMLASGAYSHAQPVLHSRQLDSSRRVKYSFQKSLLEKEWEKAEELFKLKEKINPESADSQYSILLTRTMDLPHRSPALAATMSVIIPGSGKIYAGEWKDGLIAFFFTTFSAYEAVSAFRIAGHTSILGWIYTGLAAGFYTGSIYGSYKSVHRFNNRHEETIVEDAKAIIFSTY